MDDGGLDTGFDAHLHADGVQFADDDARLLRAVDEEGSLNRAADALGRSYSRAHQRLTELEESFGPLVARQRGGSGGGGSQLTDEARELLARFERVRTEFTGTAEVEETVLSGRIVDRDGELATIETDAGRVRALVPSRASGVSNSKVQLSVRADAVTLHAPDDAPPESATSARNRFSGTVSVLEEGQAVARVVVTLDGDSETVNGERDGQSSLAALVTKSSVEKLDLHVGSKVVASFKATATRATAQED
ncbi:TOBE domain-containing protein [Halorussus halophilus]|uniref:TOBE domain-containing protein n=1 Tax=Halorussus halophilus TaxID=2650975 RepID=UPI001300ED6D|nr:TOBE domain-containing protein [Halorussus halophilus]